VEAPRFPDSERAGDKVEDSGTNVYKLRYTGRSAII
jgi:hypothetical protein